jgi:hypothetical protein
MVSSGMLRRVDLVKSDVSEEPSASFITVTRIGGKGTTLAVTSKTDAGCARFLRNVIVIAVKTSNLTSMGLSVLHRKHITSPLRAQPVNAICDFLKIVC